MDTPGRLPKSCCVTLGGPCPLCACVLICNRELITGSQESTLRAALISSPLITKGEGGLLQGQGHISALPTPSEPLCMLFHQAHLFPVPRRSHGGDAPRPPQSPTPLPHQMYLPSSLKPWTSLPSQLVYLVPCGPPGSPIPQASNLGPSTQQVLSTGLRLLGRHTRSPAQGCFSRGGQLLLFSAQGKPSLAGRGLDQCRVCVCVCVCVCVRARVCVMGTREVSKLQLPRVR